eukprot:gene38035-46215_t
MPVTKRILFDLDSYHAIEAIHDSDRPLTLQTRSMGRMIAGLRQLSNLTAFALEICQDLAAMADDVNERIKAVSGRSEKLISKIQEVDKHLRNVDITPDLSLANQRSRFLKNRDLILPPLFTKVTLPAAIESQYAISRAPPQLWRIEDLTRTDCFVFYSHPGFFFQAWLKSELSRQESAKLDRKKQRALKKAQRRERKLLRQQQQQQMLLTEKDKSSSIMHFKQQHASPAGAASHAPQSDANEAPPHEGVKFDLDAGDGEPATRDRGASMQEGMGWERASELTSGREE